MYNLPTVSIKRNDAEKPIGNAYRFKRFVSYPARCLTSKL